MVGIPKTYKFKKCDYETFKSILLANNADLYNSIIDPDKTKRLEIKKGSRILIYKNNKIIGYFGFSPYEKIIGDNEKLYKHLLNHNEDCHNI